MLPRLAAKRFFPTANGLLVRVYKTLGLAALVGILIGLVCFLSVNLFYLFDHTWIRPVMLTPEHERVVSANAHLAEQNKERNELLMRRQRLEDELAGVDRRLQANAAFEKQYEKSASGAPLDRPEALLAYWAYREAALERQDAEDRRSAILREKSLVDEGLKNFDQVIEQIEGSPYIDAMERNITVAFVPYENLSNAKPGASIYSCRLGIVWCRNVGEVVRVLEGEVEDTDPQDGTNVRGRMLEIVLRLPESGEKTVLFVGKRPLWVF